MVNGIISSVLEDNDVAIAELLSCFVLGVLMNMSQRKLKRMLRNEFYRSNQQTKFENRKKNHSLY